MNKENNLLFQIEQYFNYNAIDPSKIKIKGIPIWPAIRLKYSYFLKPSNTICNTKKKRKQQLKIRENLLLAKNIFYGFFSLFKNYDYIISTSTLERREINEKMINKLFESTFDYIDRTKTLFIENPDNNHHIKKIKLKDKNVVSTQFFKSLSDMIFVFYKNFKKNKIKIENEQILLDINRRFNVKINYRSHILHVIKLINILGFFLKIWKPKVIFVSCYYSDINYALIYSAKKIGIKVIEYQHGIINENHLAYNIEINLPKDFFPNYLFTFGDYFSNKIDNGNFIPGENIYSIGNFYLEYIKNSFSLEKKDTNIFDELRRKYKFIVAFTSQYTIEDDAINFLIEVIELSKEICVIFIPRNLKKNYSKYNLPDSIILINQISMKLDAYKTIKYCDIHSTVYSTCAYEASVLEKPNFLINIKDLSKIHLSDLLKVNLNTFILDTPHEFVEKLNTLSQNELYSETHNIFYKENHIKNLDLAFKSVLK